jgi:hypothetical protein
MRGMMTEEQAIRESGVAATTILATTAICILSAGRVLQYGSDAGGWVFAWYTEHPPLRAVIVGLSLGVALAAFFYWTLGRVKDHQMEVLVLWLIVGTVAQLLLHGLYEKSIGTITIGSANDAYIASLQHSNNEFLRLYPTLDQATGGHVARNPPGRVILYGWLRRFSDDPGKLGVAVLILSNLCGIALYYAVIKLYRNPATALSALIYYLFIPSRIYFAPLLNILGWAPVAIAWVIMTIALADDGDLRVWGAAFGICMFAAVTFDVTGLLSGGVLLVTAISYRKPRLMFSMALWATLAFAVCLVLLYAIYRINLPGMILSFVAFNRRYNADIGHRPYQPWLIGNLWEFFLGIGVPVFVLCGFATPSLARVFKERRFSVSALILLVTIVTLSILDLMGVVRGEMMRLWIPIMVLPCVVAADYSVECGPLVCAAALFGTVLQSAVTISMYRFIG